MFGVPGALDAAASPQEGAWPAHSGTVAQFFAGADGLKGSAQSPVAVNVREIQSVNNG